MGLKMMTAKVNIVLLGIMCIGLVLCSARDIEKKVKIDGEPLLCFLQIGHCVNNHLCSLECQKNNYLRGGLCKFKGCCCKV